MNAAAIDIREEEDGAAIAGGLFRRSFGDEPPAFPHHVIAYHRDARGGEVAACYVHFTPAGRILLGGGACVDRRAMRAMGPREREAVRAAGGLYRMTLEWATRHFAPSYDAIFGYCGDPLAERVDRSVGFRKTGHAHLLVYWLRDLAAHERERLVAQANSYGPF